MAVIKAPNKQYSGMSAGVVFVRGIGQTEDERIIKWFRQHGYEIEEPKEEPKEEKPEAGEPETEGPKGRKKAGA